MKKILTFSLCCVLSLSIARAEVPGFEWSVGADLTTSYLWRGINLGGLAIQPDVMVGFGGLQLEGWANISAEDYSFQALAPEFDLTLSYNIFGLRIGATHQYYFDQSKYFGLGNPTYIDYADEDYSTSQLEVFAEYHLGDVVEQVPLNIGWYTYVGGDDYYPILDQATGDSIVKRAYSSYLELSYDINFDRVGITLTPTVGITPWRSLYSDYEKNFAINNVSLKLNWEFEAGDFFTLDVYALGMLNTTGITAENIKPLQFKDSYLSQHLNFAIGVGLWFGN